ncbi:MAG TPA: FtsX-like permease family protein [Oculatellaceae cyanobacterium]
MSGYIGLFYRFILRDLGKDWIRTTLTIAGIALGVCVLLAISLANYTALAKFRETVDIVSGKANLEIRAASAAGIDENIVKQLDWLWLPGAKFTPLIQENVVFPDQAVIKDLSRASKGEHHSDGLPQALREKSDLVQLLGIDLLADADFKRFQSDTDSNDFLSMFSPGTVLIGQRLAVKHHLKEGSKFSLLLNDKLKTFTVNGVLSAEGLGGAFSGNCIIADLSTAQDSLERFGQLTQIEVIVPPADLDWVQAKLVNELPKTFVVTRPSQRGEEVEKITRSFEYNLTALTLIALMVGMFLIYNTMTISVIRRRPEIGTLRTLGVSRKNILVLFAGETLFFGVVGTALGIALGIGMADGALRAIAGTFQHFYFRDPIETVSFHPWTILFSFTLGVIVTFAAGFAPVLEAASVAPAEAVRRASYELKITGLSSKLMLIGFALFTVGVLSAMQPPVYDFPIFGYVAAFCFILAFAMLMPTFLQIALPAVSKILQNIVEPEGKIAARSLQGSLARTSVAAASLMVGIAMMISLAIMIGSFRQTVTVWIDETLKADLWLQSSARSLGSQNSRIPQSAVDIAKSTPGVAAVDPFVDIPIELHGTPTNLGAGDFEVIRDFGHLRFTSGESCAKVIGRANGHSCVVSETFSIKRGVKQGDSIELPTPNGSLSLKIQGIYYEYSSDLGYIVIPLPLYRQFFNDQTISNCAIYLSPSANSYDVRDRLFNKLGNSPTLVVRTTGELKKEAIKIFDRTFAITYALHTIAVIISVLAVMNALFALTMESKRDFGILRYLGASDGQLRKIVIVQAGILGTTGNICGVVLGFILSFLLIFVINKQSFGWTVQFQIPFEFIFESTLLVLGTALIAALVPAKMATKTLAAGVVREE